MLSIEKLSGDVGELIVRRFTDAGTIVRSTVRPYD
jgi:hypothetical protein